MSKISSGYKNLRKILYSLTILMFLPVAISAAPLFFEPVTKILPDGTSINLFVSGDEFFNYLHDANGFPVGTGKDGYYYYLLQDKDIFIVTGYRVGFVDLYKITGLKTVTTPSYVPAKRQMYQKQIEERITADGMKSFNKYVGLFNNLVIYIRFKNEPEFTVQRSVYETKFNRLNGISLRNYYKEISYGKLDLISYHFPGNATSNIYYTDLNLRDYYQPYSALTNTAGYKTEEERASREHGLLANAISWATSNYILPEDINFDVNQDDIFDNICFIIRGAADGWNELLWPHRWVLYSQDVKIRNLKVYGYTLQMENVSVTTLSHEMFHVFGAPDLYHYNDSEKPVGPWDIMANGGCHPGSWMKYKYGGWINDIPEIKESGTYVIKPLIQLNNNSYKIKSPYRDDQFFIIEYREKDGAYESLIPASGLIVQRIDIGCRGNSGGPPDEIYIFRKGGGLKIPGDINLAALSDIFGRTSFTDNTDPYSFFQDGSKTEINITNIISMGDSMMFTVDIDRPVDLILSTYEDTKMAVSWKCASEKDFLVAISTIPETITPRQGVTYIVGDTIGNNGLVIHNGPEKSILYSGLESDEPYYFSVWTIIGKNPVKYSVPAVADKRSGIYSVAYFPYKENFDEVYAELPRGWKAYSRTSGWRLSGSNPFSSPNSVLILNADKSQDNWLYTPGFELLFSSSYLITFRYKNEIHSVKESLYLQGGTNRHDFGLNLFTLFFSENFDYKDYVLCKTVLKPPESRIYYLGFKTGIEGQGVLIDDFKIEKVPDGTTSHYKPEEFYPNPTSGKTTIPATEKTKISIFRSDGMKVFETTIEAMQEIDLSSIGKGIFIIRFSTSDKTSTHRIVIL